MIHFIEPSLELALKHLEQLSADTPAKWGVMNAQQMVEHLSDFFQLSRGEVDGVSLEIPEENVHKAQSYLASERPMPRLFKANFFPDDPELRNDNLQCAIDEFCEEWVHFETFFEGNEGVTTLHPSFGKLTYEQWKRVLSKHLTHHFEQFGI